MSTASRVPETWDRSGDDPKETLAKTGRMRLLKNAFTRFRAADGTSHTRSLAFAVSCASSGTGGAVWVRGRVREVRDHLNHRGDDPECCSRPRERCSRRRGQAGQPRRTPASLSSLDDRPCRRPNHSHYGDGADRARLQPDLWDREGPTNPPQIRARAPHDTHSRNRPLDGVPYARFRTEHRPKLGTQREGRLGVSSAGPSD